MFGADPSENFVHLASRSVNFGVYSQWFLLLRTDLFIRYGIFHIWQRYLKCLLSISFVTVLYHHAVSASMLTRKIISNLLQNRNHWNNHCSQYAVQMQTENKALSLLTLIAVYLQDPFTRKFLVCFIYIYFFFFLCPLNYLKCVDVRIGKCVPWPTWYPSPDVRHLHCIVKFLNLYRCIFYSFSLVIPAWNFQLNYIYMSMDINLNSLGRF